MTTQLSPSQLEAFGAELDDVLSRTRADVGRRDVTYIRRVMRLQRTLEIGGRTLLFGGGVFWPAWVLGTASLATAKIIENMEVGHNIIHGQWDFAHDPAISSSTYEWDIVCPADQWKHSHNYLHHTYTNIRGMDEDLGYRLLRIEESQKWSFPVLFQPVYAASLALMFQWGIALHNVDIKKYLLEPSKRTDDERKKLAAIGKKAKRQFLKDYLLFPALAGPFALSVLAGNVVANLTRNLWSFTVIFCGHFSEGAETFPAERFETETRAGFYLRQILGSANFEGGKLMHFMSGHLSHQIEHHLFPDIPAHRYPEMAVEVRAICEKYGVPYNTRSLGAQFGSVVKKICRLALPPRTEPQVTNAAA